MFLQLGLELSHQHLHGLMTSQGLLGSHGGWEGEEGAFPFLLGI